MIVTIVFLLSINLLFATAIPLCSLPSELGVASTYTACLKTIPVNKIELENFVDSVIGYVKNSPYPLLFMGGPNGLTPFDTLAELETLKTQAPGWTGSVLDFFEQIHDIIGKLKDPHATVVFPFLPSFAYLLPYGFAPVAGNENSLKLIANRATAPFVASGETDYTGYIIEEMDFKKSGVYSLATVAFSEFALDVSSAGHDPHAMYNDAIKRGNAFSALELFRPEERYNSVVKLKGKDNTGNSIEVTIPWLGYFVSDTSAATFDDLNPVAVDEATPGRRRNSEKHIDRDTIKQFLPRMLHKHIPPIFVERERMMKEMERRLGVGSDLSAANSRKHESRLITSVYEKMLAARRLRPSPSTSSSPSPSPSPPPAIGLDAITLEQLYQYVDDEDTNENECTIYADTANKLGYIRYTSFMQSNGEENALRAFIKGFGEGYKKMVDKGVTDVIFDVRGNGGGLTLLVEELTDFLFHSTVYPADLDTDVLLGRENDAIPSAGANFLEAMTQAGSGPVPYYTIVDGAEQPMDSVLVPNVTKTHQNKVTNPSGTFKAEYTQRGFYKMRLNTTMRDAYGGYSPFDPQHFYIITDGVCSSCCGIFTKLAVESKAARVIGYGVNPTKKNDISTYFPGNCAGSLLGTDQIEQYRTALDSFTDAQLEEETGIPGPVIRAMLPPKFERVDVQFGVTDYEFFSRNPQHLDQTLYMVPAHVADVMPIQVSGDSDTDAVLKEIASVTKNLYIDDAAYCAPGEVVAVEDDDSCETAERTADHEVWGKTCVDSPRGLTGPCAFSHCDAGFQLSAAGCAPIPDDQGGAAVVSVPALLLALIFAMLAVFW